MARQMAISVDGLLLWPEDQLLALFSVEGAPKPSLEEIHAYLHQLQAEGKTVLPQND